MRIELPLLLACLALAIAIGHVAFTCRDRGAVSTFTVLVGTFKALAFLRRLITHPSR